MQPKRIDWDVVSKYVLAGILLGAIVDEFLKAQLDLVH
jgi:hypothetical protein